MKDERFELYRKMLEARRFEEKVAEIYAAGLIPGLAHPSIGQEAVAVGVCSALRKEDYILSCHRGHAHSIAKGVPPKFIMAELLGKETGVCKGIGGSMHSTYLETGVLFSTAIVGGNIPMATGVGLAIKLEREEKVVACFFGDGATNTGAFHEGINLAALWKLPVLFVCENNMYAVSTPVKKAVSAEKIADRSIAYGIPGERVDGMDVLAVRKTAVRGVKRAREGNGPSLLEFTTYRFKGHGMYDPGTLYRTKDEIDEWMNQCPIKRLKEQLLKEHTVDELELDSVEKEIEQTIENALKFAKESAYPSWEDMQRLSHA